MGPPSEQAASRHPIISSGVVSLPAISLRRMLAVVIGMAICGFPVYQTPLAVGIGIYALLLLRFPGIWLVVVPAALPVLDLTPWSGRVYFNEFDLLLMATVAGGLWSRKPFSFESRSDARWPGSSLLGSKMAARSLDRSSRWADNPAQAVGFPIPEGVLHAPDGRTTAGRVLDLRGRPVAGAAVMTPPHPPYAATATTDEAGRYDLGVIPEDAWVRARADGLAILDLPLTFYPDEGDIVFFLAPGYRISGRVVTEAGDPVPGAIVELEPEKNKAAVRILQLLLSPLQPAQGAVDTQIQ